MDSARPAGTLGLELRGELPKTPPHHLHLPMSTPAFFHTAGSIVTLIILSIAGTLYILFLTFYPHLYERYEYRGLLHWQRRPVDPPHRIPIPPRSGTIRSPPNSYQPQSRFSL